MQNLAMDVIENIYLANDMFVGGNDAAVKAEKRLTLQHDAMTKVRLLCYIAQLALEQKAILSKQYQQIAMQSTEVLHLLGGWVKSDRHRYGERTYGERQLPFRERVVRYRVWGVESCVLRVTMPTTLPTSTTTATATATTTTRIRMGCALL